MDTTKNSKRHMNAIAHALAENMLFCAAVLPFTAWAEVRLTTKEWAPSPLCPSELRSIQEQADMQRGIQPRPFVPVDTDADCPETEVDRVETAARRAVVALSAVPLSSRGNADLGLSYKLYIDKKNYYLQPPAFMAKRDLGDTCTPAPHDNTRPYQCVEGQRYRKDCHILIFNEKFEEVGYHRILVKEPYQFYCNAVPALGVGDASNNLVLATIQYFPIDDKHASSVAEIGRGWNRMTVALRLKRQADGHVLIEQEDECLGNPNHISTVPDAKRQLKKCAATRK